MDPLVSELREKKKNLHDTHLLLTTHIYTLSRFFFIFKNLFRLFFFVPTLLKIALRQFKKKLPKKKKKMRVFFLIVVSKTIFSTEKLCPRHQLFSYYELLYSVLLLFSLFLNNLI